ncbi:hypothetical protein AAG570_005024 [Ranatra chinensis]|uniref:Enoyl reductase (ER) domain-containing protein n=1 Tax=Ranatra chinensis TaxID=642074 RepID=A0ABD0XZ95_9HEMI
MSLRRCFGVILGRVPVTAAPSTSLRFASTYKAAVLQSAGSPLKIEDVKQKKLKKGQVRIKVKCCAVNASDYLLTQGVNPSKFPIPTVPGYEVCGNVIEANECEDVGKGDRVLALNKEILGGFAQECIADEKDVWTIPSSLNYKEGASLADSFGTALLGLMRHGKMTEKQVVMVTLAPAHGYAPLDLAANVYKAKVIGVTMAESETEIMRERGAWSALSYDEPLLISTVRDLTKNKGVDVIYDTLAGDVLKTCLQCISHEGHIIVAGYTLKELPPVQMSQLLSLPSFSISGVSLKSYRKHAFKTYRETISVALEMYDEQLIKPEIASVFPLKDVNKAIELIKEKQPVGKVILEIT